MNIEGLKKNIENKKIAVIGFGVSNKPLIKYLSKFNNNITVFDKRDIKDIEDIDSFENIGIKFILGTDYLEQLIGFDIIFRSPSMLPTNEYLQREFKKGTIITSDIDELLKICNENVYGITGSDGKTTTTSLVYEMLKKEGYNVIVGGNIGISIFDKIEELKDDCKIVLELSSFQLTSIKYSPLKALITNLSENHLDIHKDFKEYIDAKKNIYKYQSEKGYLVINKDNELLLAESKDKENNIKYFSRKVKLNEGAYYSEGKIYFNSEFVCNSSDLKIKGMHNIENFLAAITLVGNEISIDTIRYVANNFKGVEHRCEFVREVDGIRYYNDSIASSPTRTLATIKSFDKPVTIIAGGYDKNLDYDILSHNGFYNVDKLILLGDTKNKIQKSFLEESKKIGINKDIYIVNTLEEAVNKTKEVNKKGDIVILSPASASFDMFKNFEERGRIFKNILKNL